MMQKTLIKSLIVVPSQVFNTSRMPVWAARFTGVMLWLVSPMNLETMRTVITANQTVTLDIDIDTGIR